MCVSLYRRRGRGSLNDEYEYNERYRFYRLYQRQRSWQAVSQPVGEATNENCSPEHREIPIQSLSHRNTHTSMYTQWHAHSPPMWQLQSVDFSSFCFCVPGPIYSFHIFSYFYFSASSTVSLPAYDTPLNVPKCIRSVHGSGVMAEDDRQSSLALFFLAFSEHVFILFIFHIIFISSLIFRIFILFFFCFPFPIVHRRLRSTFCTELPCAERMRVRMRQRERK